MGDASPIIALAAVIAGTIIGGPWGAALVIGAGLLNSEYMKDQIDEDDALSSGIDNNRHRLNTRSSNAPLPLIYGTTQVGVNKTYLNAQNPYLHMIAEIGEGPISGIVREDGSIYSVVNTSLPRTNPPQIFLDDRIWTEIPEEFIDIQFFDGDPDQVLCTALNATVPEWQQTLPFTSYLYIKLKYDRDLYSKGDPEITVLLEGLEVYNPITTVTEPTSNAALIAYNYMTRSAENGGIGISEDRFDLTSVSEAIDYCDTKGWTYNAPVNEQNAVSDNLQNILNCFRGAMYYAGEGKFKLVFKDLNYEPVVMTLSDQTNIIENTLNVRQPSIINRPNVVEAVFIDPESNYKVGRYSQNVDFDTLPSVEQDVRKETVKLYGLDNQEKMQGMSSYYLERLRLSKTFTLVAGRDAIKLEPNDVVYVTHTVPGWVNKLARVVKSAYNPLNGGTELSFIEEELFFYNDDFDLVNHFIPSTNLPNPNDPVYPVQNAYAEEEVYFYRDRSFTRLFINFEPPSETLYPFYSHAEIYVSIGDDTNYRYKTTSVSDYFIDPVDEDETYYVKMVAVAFFAGKQVKESFAQATTVVKKIFGKTDLPSDVPALSALVAGSTVSLVAQPVPDPDIVGYEIRRGLAWDNGLFHALSNGPIFPIAPIRPGDHIFWMAAKDNSGNYSPNPISIGTTVLLPPGYTEIQRFTYDYTDPAGIFVNTEHVIFNLDDALKRIDIAITKDVQLSLNERSHTGLAMIPYTGNGDIQEIRGLGFSPDLVVVKSRDTAVAFLWFDVLRGTENYLESDSSAIEASSSASLTSFNDDGFTLGSNASVNDDGVEYVAWCAKADVIGINSTQEEKYSLDSGLSIITYEGDGVTGRTLDHSLGVKPSRIFVKRLDTAGDWIVYDIIAGATKYFVLNTTAVAQTSITAWNDTEPTTTDVTLGSGVNVNASGGDFVAYIFTEVAKVSDYGSYTGNNSTTGPVVTTDVDNKAIIIKGSDVVGNWTVLDKARDPENPAENALFLNTTSVEVAGYDLDLDDGDFQPKTTNSDINAVGTYIYQAFGTYVQSVFGTAIVQFSDNLYRIYYAELDENEDPSIYSAQSNDPQGPWSIFYNVALPTGGDNVNGCLDPDILFDFVDTVETYKLYYTGLDASDVSRVMYKSGADGISFSNDATHIDPGDEGTYDVNGAGSSSVIKMGEGNYFMLYTGEDASDVKRIISCVSADGKAPWTNHQLAIDIDIVGDVDQYGVKEPSMVYDDQEGYENIMLFYTGIDIEGTQTILVATSTNFGVSFNSHRVALSKGTEGTYDVDNVGHPDFIEGTDRSEFYYTGTLNTLVTDTVNLEWNGANATWNAANAEVVINEVVKATQRILHSEGSINPASFSGTWTSPVEDLGSIQSFQLYLEFDQYFESSASTWDGIAPIPTVWNGINALTDTWAQKIAAGSTGQITAILRHKQNLGDSWTIVGNFELYTLEITARYIQVEWTITDPTADAFTIVGPSTIILYSGPTPT